MFAKVIFLFVIAIRILLCNNDHKLFKRRISSKIGPVSNFNSTTNYLQNPKIPYNAL